jgi:hypothetical protein
MTAKIILSALFLALPLSVSSFTTPADCEEVKRILKEANTIPYCQTCAPRHQAKLNEMKGAHDRCMTRLSSMAVSAQVENKVDNSQFPVGGFGGEYSLMPSENH